MPESTALVRSPTDTAETPEKPKTDPTELLRLIKDDPKKFANDLVPALPKRTRRKPPTHPTRRKFFEAAMQRADEARRRAAVIVAMKIQGYTNVEIARMLKLHRDSVKRVLALARKKYGLADHIDQLHFEVVPEAIETIHHHLKRNRDKDLAVDTLKGVGIFETHSKGNGHGGPVSQSLTLNVVNQRSAESDREVVGEIVGTPREDVDA